MWVLILVLIACGGVFFCFCPPFFFFVVDLVSFSSLWKKWVMCPEAAAGLAPASDSGIPDASAVT